MSEDNKKYEDFLDGFLNSDNVSATPKPTVPTNKPKEDISVEVPKAKTVTNIEKPILKNKERDLNLYDDIAIEDLPMGHLYFPGTTIKYRDLTVEEVEFFATLDTSNAFDFKKKLNEVLDSCISFQHPDGTFGNYLDIKEGDRAWILYTIREKSFLNGHKLKVNVNVKDKEGKKAKFGIELIRANIEVWDKSGMDEFFSNEERCYTFVAEFGSVEKTYKIAPPTIGLSNCFDQYLRIRYDELKDDYSMEEIKDKINSKFFEIAPFMKPHIVFMDVDELRELEKWFTESISKDEFFFLNNLIESHLKLGIRGLKKNMAGTTIRTNKIYPEEPRDFFIVPNAFRLFLKQ
jgi:hypothetical protein